MAYNVNRRSPLTSAAPSIDLGKGLLGYELPGSGEIHISEGDVTAVRMFRIEWNQSNFNKLLEGMTTDLRGQAAIRSIRDKSGSNVRDFPLWPGQTRAPDLWGTRLVARDISIVPSHGGRQAGITETTLTTNSKKLVGYDSADVTITYSLMARDDMTPEWSSRSATRVIKGVHSFATSGAGISQGVEKYEAQEEILTTVRFSELQLGNKAHDKIRDLENTRALVGTVNSRTMFFCCGKGRAQKNIVIDYEDSAGNAVTGSANVNDAIIEFPPRTILFYSWEIQHAFRWGKLDTHLIYRFLVSPAFTEKGRTNPPAEITDPKSQYDWRYIFDEDQNRWDIAVDSDGNNVYEQKDLNQLIPWSAYEQIDKLEEAESPKDFLT